MKLVLFSMVAAIALFSVGCSDTSSSPKANTSNASVKKGNVAVAAPADNPAEVEEEAVEEEPVQANARQVKPVRQTKPVRQAAPDRQAPVRQAPPPEPVAQPVSGNESRYFVQTQDGDALNLRASNSTNSAVVGSLPYGTEVIVHLSDRSGEWAEVSAPGGKQGWVAMRFLSQDAVAAPQRVPQSQGGGTSGYYIRMRVSTLDGTNVNIRSGPSLEDAVVGVLATGETVTRMGEVGQWTEVDTGNGTGFVASQYLVPN
jgi:uncharacterized protein YraI